MVRYTVFAKCTLDHSIAYNAQRRAAGLGPVLLDTSEWYGITSTATQAEADAWIATHREQYKEFDRWSVQAYTR